MMSWLETMFFVLNAVQLVDPKEIAELLAQIAARPTQPGLIVFDTLATCFVGGDENSAQEMGRVVAAVRNIQRTLNTAVMLVHHTGKPAEVTTVADLATTITRRTQGRFPQGDHQ